MIELAADLIILVLGIGYGFMAGLFYCEYYKKENKHGN